MDRKHSHFENKEPFFENFLRDLRFRKVIKHIPAKSKVLDLGCGYNGELLRETKDRLSAGFGLGLSVNPDHQDDKIFLIEHDLAYPLPFRDNEFDAVTSLANLEHLEDPEKSLREIYRVLKPGGALFLTAPSAYGKPVLEILVFIGLVSEREILDHKHYFNKKILAEYCEKTGFSSWKHKYFQLWMNNFLIAKK